MIPKNVLDQIIAISSGVDDTGDLALVFYDASLVCAPEEEYPCIGINFETGLVTCYDENDDVVKMLAIKVTLEEVSVEGTR